MAIKQAIAGPLRDHQRERVADTRHGNDVDDQIRWSTASTAVITMLREPSPMASA
jgi:hypothetical protein